MLVKTADYVLDVDVEATKEYYANSHPCDCPNCRNFYAQIKDRFPELLRFLAGFGVDAQRADEMAPVEVAADVDYLWVGYTVVGQIKQETEIRFPLTDGESVLEITIDNSYIPNEHTADNYFTITVYGIYLPWVLDEPFEEFKPKASLLQRFKRIFQKQSEKTTPPRPTWDEVVEIMYDKDLTFDDELVKVVYSIEKSKRYVVLKNKKGFYTYRFETLYAFDEEEWRYTYSGEDTLPGMWESLSSGKNRSFFGTEDEAMTDLIAEPAYKEFFGGD